MFFFFFSFLIYRDTTTMIYRGRETKKGLKIISISALGVVFYSLVIPFLPKPIHPPQAPVVYIAGTSTEDTSARSKY